MSHSCHQKMSAISASVRETRCSLETHTQYETISSIGVQVSHHRMDTDTRVVDGTRKQPTMPSAQGMTAPPPATPDRHPSSHPSSFPLTPPTEDRLESSATPTPTCTRHDARQDNTTDGSDTAVAGDAPPPAPSPMSVDELECSLCLRLLHAPVTTTCGHSFCQGCLFRVSTSTTSNNCPKCPMCRAVLPMSGSRDNLAVNRLLERMIHAYFPVEHAARLAEEAADNAGAATEGEDTASPMGAAVDSIPRSLPSDSQSARVPLFELDPTLPSQQIHLRVFEPRYVRMIERCLTGSRRFGMVGTRRWSHSGHPPELLMAGTEVEITDLDRRGPQLLHVTAVGRRMFRIHERMHTDDGYTIAQVEWVDTSSTIPPEETEALQASRDLGELVAAWLAAVHQGGWERAQGQLDWITNELGPMPAEDKCDARAVWVAALINPLPALGVAPEIRPAMLAARTTAERLAVATHGIHASLEHMAPSRSNRLLAAVLDRVGLGVPNPPTMRLLSAVLPWVAIVVAISVRTFLYPEETSPGDGQLETAAMAAATAAAKVSEVAGRERT
eukprot:m.170067 g.170067  ORF g.170067 m.170067 type:complete len:558 (+) comp13190_c0_seq1:3-1676(+)